MTMIVRAPEPETAQAHDDRPERAPRRVGRMAAVWVVRLAIIGGFAAFWQSVGSGSAYDKLVYSTPGSVVNVIWNWLGQGSWWSNLETTLEEAVLGYALGLAIALVLVLIVVPSDAVGRFLAPFIAAINSLPKIALAPLFILWFGTSLKSKVLFVVSLIAFMIFYGVQTALRTIDRDLLANAKILGASRVQMVRQVYGPATVGYIITSLRLSSAWALLAAVIAEYLGANKGLGYLIAQGQQNLQSNIVIAGVIVVGLIACVLDRALVRLERRLSRWRLSQ